MNYYPHHIGDFIRDTSNLNDHQLATYMRMIWAYYLAEKPFTASLEDIAFAMRSDEKTIQLLLRHYFTQEDDGWHHKRIDKEIENWNKRGWFPRDPDAPMLRPSIDEWKETRKRIFARDNYTCKYCGKIGSELECDHVHPVSLGGSNDDSNLTTACKPCNRRKSNKPVATFLQEA